MSGDKFRATQTQIGTGGLAAAEALRLFAPIGGNYVKTFIEIAAACSDGTKFLTFRGYRWNDQEEQFWKALNTVTARTIGIMRVFEVSSFIKEVRKLKSGHHLFVLCDLFSDFGNTQPVQVFGKCLHLASGWVRVCYIANSIVILVAPISRDRDHLQIIDVIDPRHSPSLDHFMHQCMHSVQWSLEHLIAENPGYWFMWEHVEKYEAIN